MSFMGKKKLTKQEARALKDANDTNKQETEHALHDRVYYWIIDRYTKNNHKFNFSDAFVWKGAVYVIPEIIGYLIFFTIFLTLAYISFKKYGEARTIVFFILLLIWRVNLLLKVGKRIQSKL